MPLPTRTATDNNVLITISVNTRHVHLGRPLCSLGCSIKRRGKIKSRREEYCRARDKEDAHIDRKLAARYSGEKVNSQYNKRQGLLAMMLSLEQAVLRSSWWLA